MDEEVKESTIIDQEMVDKEKEPKVIEPGSPGDEFELTAEMMVNDFDDERTLDEEEALEESDEQQSELSNLEKEKDMPIEALLAMYGYTEETSPRSSPQPEAQAPPVSEPNVAEETTVEVIFSNSIKASPKSNESEENSVKTRIEDVVVDIDNREETLNHVHEQDNVAADCASEEPEIEKKSLNLNEKLVEDKNEVSVDSPATEEVPMEIDCAESTKEEDEDEDLEEQLGDCLENQDPEEEDMVDDDEAEKEPPSMLRELYKDDPVIGNSASATRHLRSGSRQQSDEDEEEEDEDIDYSPNPDGIEEDWKKTIMVGTDYQAVIPDEGLQKYDDAMPYENEDKLLWDPHDLTDNEIKDFLIYTEAAQMAVSAGVHRIPKGSHVRDDEQALYLFLQCGLNPEEAIRRHTINSIPPSMTSSSLWSEEECRNFESGLRQYGKDFHTIQQNRVRTRTVSELVQFYYLWKKTERHDLFAVKARLEKKKYILHPGTTDFMERFLDDQDSPTTSPNVHSLLSGDPKRHKTPPLPQPVINNNTTPPLDTTTVKDETINNHFDDGDHVEEPKQIEVTQKQIEETQKESVESDESTLVITPTSDKDKSTSSDTTITLTPTSTIILSGEEDVLPSSTTF